MSDDYAARQAALDQYWAATASCYQAMADAYLAEDAKEIEGWLASYYRPLPSTGG